MSYRHLYIAIVAMGIGCLGSLNAEACEVKLLVKNRSSATIVGFGYRNAAGLEMWNGNLISSFVGPNDTQTVTWQGSGDYDLGITFTDIPDPIVVPVQNICTKSQVIANPSGIAVQ